MIYTPVILGVLAAADLVAGRDAIIKATGNAGGAGSTIGSTSVVAEGCNQLAKSRSLFIDVTRWHKTQSL